MKRGKATGEDNVFVEMLKAMDDFAIDELTAITNQVNDTLECKKLELCFLSI